MKIEYRWLLMIVLLTVGFSLHGAWLWVGMVMCFFGGWQLGEIIVQHLKSK